MYEVLRDCLRRADIQSTAAYAVLYECVLTCTAIYPSSQLVEIAARAVGRFLRSDNNNLKYLGINALASIVSVNPTYASDHKALVIDCLDDPDETLKRKTLDLLCKMTNPANVKVITEKLISYLQSTVDIYLRRDLVPRVVQLAEQFAPDNVWYVETLNSLFRIAGDLIDPSTAHNLMRLIAEGMFG
jgi:AP-4 complex subunit epsilon-1